MWVRDRCASEAFFWFVLVLLAANALLIALAADNYLLYDESYHVGIIDVYSHQWSPILGEDAQRVRLGDTERLPSYLFHYLMSFPYRGARAIGLESMGLLAVMRALNVAMVALSFVWFRRTLLLLGMSRAAAHVALAIFSVVPVVVFVAATVNYDNLVLLLGSVFLWHTARVAASDALRVRDVLLVIAFACLVSITKYTFLLIAAAAVVLLGVHLLRSARRTGVRTWWRERERLGAGERWALLLLVAVAIALFVERIGRNVLDHGTPSPDCATLHSEEFCRTNPVWARNERLAALQPDRGPTPAGALTYLVVHWAPGIVRTVTLVGGGTPSGSMAVAGTDVALALTWVIGAVGATMIVLAAARGRRHRAVLVLAAVVTFYVVLAFGANYSYFLSFGQPLAVQARYFIVVLPFVIGAAVAATSWVLQRTQASPLTWKVTACAVGLVVATQGAGPVTYVVRSQDAWFGPASITSDVIGAMREVLRHVVIGS